MLATSVQGLKAGLLFAGVSGPAAVPFASGTLCVQPPIKRGPPQSSGGSAVNACDGAFGIVVNDGAVLPTGLDAGAGNSAWYQWWYRDPVDGSALSAAHRLDYQ